MNMTSYDDDPTDRLTGLATRVALEVYLAKIQANQELGRVAVASVELSRFGNVNDSLGSELANRIIATTAKRLIKIFADAALIARTHGDHFCLVFVGDVDMSYIISRLQDFTQCPLALKGEVIVMSVRVGYAGASDSSSASSLLGQAEAALHKAKRTKVQALQYSAEITDEARSVQTLENDLSVSLVTRHVELHRALNNDEFKLLYQPIVDAVSGNVECFEALVRWVHPKRGFVSPSEFIPMAEQIQVIDVLSNWIMRKAMLDAKSFSSNPDGSQSSVSINLSPIQFIHPEVLIGTVEQALDESGLSPSLVKLEVTESAAFVDSMPHTLARLRDIGVSIALDDFGTGYSSLTQLTSLPVNFVKLDRSFISDIGGDDPLADDKAGKLTRAVFSLAEAYDLSTIVEGVETGAQLERLLGYGARLIQGFYFSRPLPIEEAVGFSINNTR